MANPQLSHGHVRIAHPIVLALARVKMPPESIRCFLIILDKTYGYGKKKDLISVSQFEKFTGLDRRHVCRGIRWLAEANMILVFRGDGKRGISSYAIQKDYDMWKTCAKRKKSKSVNPLTVAKNGDSTVAKNGAHINNIKQTTIINKIPPSAGFFEESLKTVFNDGLNIYALMNRVKTELKWPAGKDFPEEVVLSVCDFYWKEKEKIRNPWPWFIVTLKQSIYNYHAKKNIDEHNAFREEYRNLGRGGDAISIGEVLEKLKDLDQPSVDVDDR
jgi:phage replication O-like protein O